VFDIGVLLVDHVEMALENRDGRGFVAFGSGYADDDVAGVVRLMGKAMALRHLDDVLPRFLLLLGAARNGQDLVEVPPERLGLESCDKGHVSSL
jgi:hypothetical protein